MAERDPRARRDLRMMDRALKEARKGRPSPNPHVGAVIADGDEIVAVGHHERAGEAHAEVDAIQRAGERTKGATLYVTFEPCNHFGRTPPCTDAILAAGIARVVIGCRDPKPHVPGAIERLRAAGLEVELGTREDEAWELVEDFAKHITRALPYVTLKAAVTLDGHMATRSGDSKWISSPGSRKEAHRMRAYCDAVLVGSTTVLTDDPELTVRLVKGESPTRVVLDTDLRTPPTAKLARSGTIIFHAPSTYPGRAEALTEAGVTLIPVPVNGDGTLELDDVLRELGRRDIVRLLVEGGSTVHGAFLDAGLADRVAIFVAPRIIGAHDARPFAAGRGVDRIRDAFRLEGLRTREIDGDVLFEGRVVRGQAEIEAHPARAEERV